MKILKKGDDFVKVPDSTLNDLIKIQTMTERGWRFVQKKEYKDFKSGDTKIKDEAKPSKKVKEVKEVKEPKKIKEVKKDKEVKKNKK